MAYTIAVAGKGGTGKTTLTGMLITYMCEHDMGPILVVDADANANLNEVLGVEVENMLGDIREVVARADRNDDESPIPASMSKQEFMEYKMNSCLIEEDDYDMLVMGRSEGKGCYCFVNDLLQRQIERLAKNYKYIVVDNEAGMEHISRGTLPAIDTLILVSDCSRRGVQAVGRIRDLAAELKIVPETTKLVVNRAPSQQLASGIEEEIAQQDLDLLGVVPQDQLIYEFDCDGKPTCDMPEESVAKQAFAPLLDQLFA